MKAMRRILGVCLAVGFVMFIFARGWATDQKKPTVERSSLVTVTATVEALNLENRMITLKGPKENTVTFKVDERVKNLPQVKVGDQVIAKYYESVAVRMAEAGEPLATSTGGVTSAKPGQMPGAVAAKQVTVTASVEAIDKKTPSITLKGPEGNVVTVRVMDPKNLEKVKVEDKLTITYTEALAISVERAGK
jgi:DNA-directed RNA polymerase alpha subunit